ncbi:type 2 lanthipeptide synthetase LanM family protein [Actinocrispum sp. NPDC049592]|uniref:type 2 lanthipeptide synthetase LanM family protein n=1 Tax=Actinocrispum sp. NPDC049592 TaxID=3154835 RepID=UPI0034170189
MSTPSADYLTPYWWAGGLALQERLPATTAGSAPERLERWRGAPGDEAAALFGERLAAVGIDEAGASALLAEPHESLGVRSGRPMWTDLVEEAVAGAEDVPVDTAAFTGPVQPFVTVARAKLTRAVSGLAEGARIDLDAVLVAFAEQLGARLARLAARTLVLELNVARVTGSLTGHTAAERFADFTGQVTTTAGLARLLAEYPVLGRLLGQDCQYAVAAATELLERFAADRPAIAAALTDGDPGTLVAVEAGAGDRHGRGRSVSMLRFDSGDTVVYKPRPVALQAHFTDLVAWLNTKVPGLGLRTARCLVRPGYGWLEFIRHGPCTEVSEVDRFYRRQGALLALLYAVDGTDIHFENLIAAADQPVLVDVETLFHPTVPPVLTAGPDPAVAALGRSVLRTALLPQLLFGEQGALDISGLGGDKGTTFPFEAVGWSDTGTDEMRLVRRSVEFHGAVNRPTLHGRDADPADYEAALLTGFRAGYDAIVAHRDDLIGPDGLLSACSADEIRIVLRPTRVYATLLDESTHPTVLRDGLDRDRVLDALWADPMDPARRRRLIRHEVADLWAGDVPMFVGRPGSRDVWTATGDRLAGLLDESGLAAVTAKITAMGEVDQHEQEWLITAALATRLTEVEHQGRVPVPSPVVPVVPDAQRLLATACGIADEIVARALPDRDGVNWLGLEPIDWRYWAVLPMSAGLADGYTGVALFLAQVGALTGAARYTDLARRALHRMPLLLDTLDANADAAAAVGPGLLGFGGICYALARIATLLNDDEARDCLARAVDLAGRHPDDRADVVFGDAGGLLAMLAVHAETGLPSARSLAGRFAARLLECPQWTDMSAGFAMGPAGAGHALLRYAKTVGGQRYAEAGVAAIEKDTTPWRDHRTPDYGWCAGLSGAVLARSADLDRFDDVERCVPTLATRDPLRDNSLCHGELGAMEALTVLAAAGNEQAAMAWRHGAGRVLAVIDRLGPRCATPNAVRSPGMLTGLSGIGYGLLRLGFPESVPSVLLLEPGS